MKRRERDAQVLRENGSKRSGDVKNNSHTGHLPSLYAHTRTREMLRIKYKINWAPLKLSHNFQYLIINLKHPWAFGWPKSAR